MHLFLKLVVAVAVINRNFVEGCGGSGPCK